MGKTPFAQLFFEAWKASSPRVLTFVFGALVAIGMTAGQLAFQAVWHPDEGSIAATLRALWPEYAGLLIAVATGALVAHECGRANLIAALAARPARARFGAADMASRFAKVLLIDSITIVVLSGLALVFALPLVVALVNNRGAFEGAAFLSAFAFLPVFIGVSFIRQYGTFYALLSPLRFRLALDHGAALFARFAMRSFGFWVFLMGIAVAFTFLLNAAMLGTSVLFQRVGLADISSEMAFLIAAAGLIWFTVFDQALILRFFEDIASGKAKEQPVSEEQVLDPGMPVA